jgi:ribosomal protein S18 acetylase RimI-like enzyme
MPASTTFEIRPATSDDRDAIQRLWEEAGLSGATPDEWDALVDGPANAILVAEEGGAVVGSAIAAFDGWRAYIYHVAVVEHHRRQGLGHNLVMRAEQYLAEAGARRVYVMVHEENTEGLALVGSVGYLPEGEIVLVKPVGARFAQGSS